MPFAFVHLTGAWLAGKAYQRISGRTLPHYAWIFLLIGSILPDIDHLLDWTFQVRIHRSFTHSILFAFIISIVVYIIFKSLNHTDYKSYALAIGCGVLTHLLLDAVSYPGAPLLWPSQLHFSIIFIGYPNTASFSLFHLPLAQLKTLLKWAVFDMAVGTSWLFYLAFRKSIKF